MDANGNWLPDWSGQICLVIGAGPSASFENLSRFKGKARFVAVNNSWQLAPWSDILYGCDVRWWRSRGGVKEFRGIKASQDRSAAKEFEDVRLVPSNLYSDLAGLKRGMPVGWGNNGGFQAMCLAGQCGPSKIILVGFDMRLDLGIHWHGPHKHLPNPNSRQVKHWRKVIDAAAPKFQEAGIEVVNASLVSALTAFPKCSLDIAVKLDEISAHFI